MSVSRDDFDDVCCGDDGDEDYDDDSGAAEYEHGSDEGIHSEEHVYFRRR